MTTKTTIVSELGEGAVLLPDLIAEGLAANDRAKLRLTMLQGALQHADQPHSAAPDFARERARLGLDGGQFDRTVAGSRSLGGGAYAVPGAALLVDGLFDDLKRMLVAVETGEPARATTYQTRLGELSVRPRPAGDAIAAADVAALASARRGETDTAHLLMMDLHKELNRLTAETASENLAGALVHRLADSDRPRVEAFMRGLHRTAPLAFGHPGLGTTATRTGNRLVIQNDIGTTDAHVLVVHLDDLTVTITYTDVHRMRAAFFRDLFKDHAVEWSNFSESHARGIADDAMFVLVTGHYVARDLADLDAFLAFLGSRIVFLIDWNKARKALGHFIDNKSAVELLTWAVRHDLGHRALLVLGGAELVNDAVRRVAENRVPYGTRLDDVFGTGPTGDFLRRVLTVTSEGMSAHRSERLIRDEIQADLALRFERAESALLTVLVRHAGLARMLAGALADALNDAASSPAGRHALAQEAKRLEEKADRLTVELRGLATAASGAEAVLRAIIDSTEDAVDALEEAAFLLSLLPPSAGAADAIKPVASVADIAVGSSTALVQALAAAAVPAKTRIDTDDALEAIDMVSTKERAADDAQRAAFAALIGTAAEPRQLVVALEIVRAIETATDHLARAALKLRERLLAELSP